LPDRNLIVTIHYYRPMSFTHQGTPWTEQRTKTGVTWDGTEAERQAIKADFNKAEAWAGEHRRPMFLGEFGAYDKADMDSRARWTNFVARQAEARGWSWAYWQFTNDFVLYDIPHHRWVEPIRLALIPSGG
jgi:endoglucanase